MSEIEKRLREFSYYRSNGPPFHVQPEICREAADEIASLHAMVTRKSEQYIAERQAHDTTRAQLTEAITLLKRLSAEVLALNGFEHGVRFQIGNTNYAVLTERAKDAGEFIERVGK